MNATIFLVYFMFFHKRQQCQSDKNGDRYIDIPTQKEEDMNL